MACFQKVLTKVKGMTPHPLLVVLQGSLDAVHLLRELQECAASANDNALLNSGLQGWRACQISLLLLSGQLPSACSYARLSHMCCAVVRTYRVLCCWRACQCVHRKL